MRNESLFEDFIQGMDSKLQAQLRLEYASRRILDEVERKREMEQMEQRITQNVLSKIQVQVVDEASAVVQKLIDQFNRLGG